MVKSNFEDNQEPMRAEGPKERPTMVVVVLCVGPLRVQGRTKYGAGREEVYITPTLGSVVRPPPLRTRC